MIRILFVDDEPHLLDGLRRALRSMRNTWNMSFAEGGAQALVLLASQPFDVIVTDMRMPGMDGAELLSRVRHLYPHMTRIILSGHTEKSAIMTSVRLAHQFLSKPCDPDQLRSVLGRTEVLRSVLHHDNLVSLVARIESLPPLPTSYTRLLEALDSESSSLDLIGQLITQDMGLTATVLKLVNSAFFGIPHPVGTPSQAASLLGLDIIKGLVLTQGLFQVLGPHLVPGMSFEGLWRHCLTVGGFAKTIAQTRTADKILIDNAFIAGIVHDVGKLVFASVLPQEYDALIQRVRQENRLVWSMEREVFGTTHNEVGAYLMGLWGEPEEVVSAVASHNQPGRDFSPAKGEGQFLLAAVHVANVFEHEMNVIHPPYDRPVIDQAFLSKAGLLDSVPRWRGACQELALNEDANGTEQAG